jgi:hypothetical protein
MEYENKKKKKNHCDRSNTHIGGDLPAPAVAGRRDMGRPELPSARYMLPAASMTRAAAAPKESLDSAPAESSSTYRADPDEDDMILQRC